MGESLIYMFGSVDNNTREEILTWLSLSLMERK